MQFPLIHFNGLFTLSVLSFLSDSDFLSNIGNKWVQHPMRLKRKLESESESEQHKHLLHITYNP